MAHRKSKARRVTARMPTATKRSIGKEIIQGLEEFKAWRRGELKLKTRVVEMPVAADVSAKRKPAPKVTANKLKPGSGNVFQDVGFPPAEADNLMLRAQLMSRVRDAARGASRREAAKRFGITQPRLNDVLRGRIDKFSLDALVNMLAHAGLRVGTAREKSGVDLNR